MHSLLRKIWKDQQLNVSKLPDMKAFATGAERRLPSGARYFCYWPQSPIRGWLLSLHGGPESYEGREVRYGGLYQALLENGVGVVVLNYRGSKRKGQILGATSEIWGRWSDSIVEDVLELFLQLPKRISEKPLVILGGSFGGSLALILAQTFGADGLVLFSPLLDLKEQMSRAGSFYAQWFRQRFSVRDVRQISLQNAMNISCPVLMAFSHQDEVLGARTHQLFQKKVKFRRNWVFLEQNCPHAPLSYQDCKRRYLSAYEFICQTIDKAFKTH